MPTINAIEKIDLQLEQLRNQRALLQAEEKSAQKKRRIRKCIVIGAYLMVKSPELVAAIGRQQTLKHNRALFDLPPPEESPAAPATSIEADIFLPIAGDLS